MNTISSKSRIARSLSPLCSGSAWHAHLSCFVFLIFPPMLCASVPVINSSSASLTLTDPAAPSNLVGMFLATNNDVVVASTPNVNTSTGAALVFDRHTGQLLRRLTAADGKQNDFFGTHLDLDGNKLIVGTNGYGDSAYLFDVSTGQQLQKFSRPSTASESFGFSVAIKNNLALVGDPSDSVNGYLAGAAYILDVTTGNTLYTLRGLPGDTVSTYQNYFGNAVALDDRYAYIGSPGDGYVYQFDLGTGLLVRRVRGTDTRGSDDFGSQIAVDNGRFLVGAFDHSIGTAGGTAYLFDSQTGAQLKEFFAPQEVGRFGQFGTSLDLSGDSVLIGAPRTTGSVGAAYLYDLSSANPIAKFQPSGLPADSIFGLALKLDGSTAIISSPGFHHYDGAVYIFEVPEPRIDLLLIIGACSLFLCTTRLRTA